MAKKDKFVYSTDYLANIHATTTAAPEVVEQPVASEPVKGWDEKGKIEAPKAKKGKGKK